mgnify:CR=1 FL=1
MEVDVIGRVFEVINIFLASFAVGFALCNMIWTFHSCKDKEKSKIKQAPNRDNECED